MSQSDPHFGRARLRSEALSVWVEHWPEPPTKTGPDRHSRPFALVPAPNDLKAMQGRKELFRPFRDPFFVVTIMEKKKNCYRARFGNKNNSSTGGN